VMQCTRNMDSKTCLWADGLTHQSLSEMEFLYLTLAYDWMLFSHQLKKEKRFSTFAFISCSLSMIDGA
jgi:hypothetical protein